MRVLGLLGLFCVLVAEGRPSHHQRIADLILSAEEEEAMEDEEDVLAAIKNDLVKFCLEIKRTDETGTAEKRSLKDNMIEGIQRMIKVVKGSKSEPKPTLSVVGQGSFGKVFRLVCGGVETDTVVKQFSTTNKQTFDHEVAMLRAAQNAFKGCATKHSDPDYFPKYLGTITVEPDSFMLLRYMDGVAANEPLPADSEPAVEVTAVQTAIRLQISEQLACLHRNGIVHNDVKPDNIRYKRAGDGTIRVGLLDFGEACLFKNIGTCPEKRGAYDYMKRGEWSDPKPETDNEEPNRVGFALNSPGADWFSLARVLQELGGNAAKKAGQCVIERPGKYCWAKTVAAGCLCTSDDDLESICAFLKPGPSQTILNLCTECPNREMTGLFIRQEPGS